jgi:glycosyltransferase involved in cell wall biosynthesis
MDLAVVTTTLPERADMLAELAACMEAQTLQPADWLVHVDEDREGPATCINRLVERTDTEWIFRCDDDDLFDPEHFETLSEGLDGTADIVYTWPRITPPGWLGERGLQHIHPIATLRHVNWIASALAMRRSLWDDLGGYADGPLNEDHDLIIRAVDAGARFRCIPKVTWTYRLGPWPHRSQGEL